MVPLDGDLPFIFDRIESRREGRCGRSVSSSSEFLIYSLGEVWTSGVSEMVDPRPSVEPFPETFISFVSLVRDRGREEGEQFALGVKKRRRPEEFLNNGFLSLARYSVSVEGTEELESFTLV